MSFLLQATTKMGDLARLQESLDWLAKEVGHAEGLVGLRVFRAADDPDVVTMLEEWESRDAFERSFETYSVELRGQFLAKLGLTTDSFERAFWLGTDIAIET